MKELWGEEVKTVDLGFEVEFSPEAEERMDDRMILKSDVIQVLQHLRESGEAVLEEDTGLFVTRERLGNVTFWVKYRETEKGYLVCSAYSHRMKVVTRQ